MSTISLFAHDKKHKSTKKTISIKTKIFCDHCVKCESCKARVENKVYELKGIRSVEMNPKSETILVIYNPKFITAQKIKEQVASTGYDADDVKATQEQINGLDDCCKKPL
jgi:copper chaperone CopZ